MILAIYSPPLSHSIIVVVMIIRLDGIATVPLIACINPIPIIIRFQSRENPE
jgi:hypothetical protein